MQGTAPKRIKTQGQVAKRSKITKTTVPRSLSAKGQPFARQTVKTLVYCEQVLLTLVGGGYTEYKFTTNGMFDPNVTGGTIQPLYFDQLMAIYNYYTVSASTLTLTVSPNVNCQKTTVVIVQDDDSTGDTAVTYAIQRPGAVYSQGNFHGGLYPHSLRSTWSAKKNFSGNPASRDELSGTSTANPTQLSYYIISAQDNSPLGDVYLTLTARIEFTATFYDLKTIAPS